MNKVKELIAQLDTVFMRLSEREKKLVVATAILLCVFIFILIHYSLTQNTLKAQKQGDYKAQQLAEILSLQDIYRQREESSAALRQRLKRNDVKIVALVEDEAKKQQINLLNISPRESDNDTKTIKTQFVDFRAQKLSYDKLTTFIEHLEAQSHPVKVIRLLIKKRFDEKDLLDIEATVATYKAY